MDAETREALATFREELEDRLAAIRRTAGTLGAGGVPPEAMRELFRQFHSLKGAANLLGLQPVEKLAHKLEDVLALARDRGVPPGTPLGDFLMAAAGRLEEMGNHLARVRVMDASRDLATVDRFVRGHWGGAG